MTQDEIIRMGMEAGMRFQPRLDSPRLLTFTNETLERFAALVAAHEREKQAEQEPFDMNDHPPHRLCECRKCMEYFTPLPDCDAFAAYGKPIDHIPDATKMVAEPVKHSEHYWLHEINNARADGYERGYAAGKAEPVKQEPVGVVESSEEWGVAGVLIAGLPIGTKLYSAPVDAKAIRAEAYQQGRNEMKEEAAKVCESKLPYQEEYDFQKASGNTARACAAAIRGMK